jgi:histidinol dehydrogenase
MQLFINPSPETWPALCVRPQVELEFLENSVKNILARVQRSGDEALRELTKQFDKADVTQIQVTEQEIEQASTISSVSIESCYSNSCSSTSKNFTLHKSKLLFLLKPCPV